MSGDIAGLLRKLIKGQEETNTRLARIEAAELTAHARRMAAVGALRAAVDEPAQDDRPIGIAVTGNMLADPVANAAADVLIAEYVAAEQDDGLTEEQIGALLLKGAQDATGQAQAAEQDGRPPMVRLDALPVGAWCTIGPGLEPEKVNAQLGDTTETWSPTASSTVQDSSLMVRPIAADPGPQEGDGREWWAVSPDGTTEQWSREDRERLDGDGLGEGCWLCPVEATG